MIRAVATKVEFQAYDYTTGAPKTGDAANITAYVMKDHGAVTVLADTSATEMSSTNAPGVYQFDVAATEADADDLLFTAKSSTANVVLVPVRVATVDIVAQGVIARGTAQAATSTTIQLAAAETFADNVLVGCTIMAFGSTQGYWQSRACTGYVGSTDTATVDTWAVTPSGTVTYKVIASAPVSSTGVTVNPASLRSAIGIASANVDAQFSSIDGKISNALTRMPAALGEQGNMKSDLRDFKGVIAIGDGTAGNNIRPTGVPAS